VNPEEMLLNAMGTQQEPQIDPLDYMQQMQAEFSGFDPDVTAQLAPLLNQRQALQSQLAKQLDDYNRLLQSTEGAQVGSLSTGQGIASALVGLLPTLVAGAIGGTDAAAAAAGAGVKGMDLYRDLNNEEQKSNLQRLLGLTRNQAALAGRTQGQISSLDRQASQLAVQRQNQKDRLEDRALTREQQRQIAMSNLGLREGMLEIARAREAAKNSEFSDLMKQRINEVINGGTLNVDGLSRPDAEYLKGIWEETRRQKGLEISEKGLQIRERDHQARTTSGMLANIPGTVPTKDETKEANLAHQSLMTIRRNAIPLVEMLAKDGVQFFGPMSGEQQRRFSTLVEELKNLKKQGANFTFMERGINVDQITGGVDLANFRDAILKTGMYGRNPAESLRRFVKEMETQAQIREISNKYYDVDSIYDNEIIRKVAKIHGREAAKALLENRKK
jgi:hypothetical protein